MRTIQKQRAFTLVELLLVLMIMGLMAAITVPNFVGSIGVHRLKTAVRTVVSSGRYTRSMAVMKQESMVLVFDLDMGTITASSTSSSPSPLPEEEPIEEDFSFDENEEEPKSNSFGAELFHQLEKVFIDYVELDDDEQTRFTEGKCSIIYYSNGRCTPYSVKIMDGKGNGMIIDIDALSSVKTKQ